MSSSQQFVCILLVEDSPDDVFFFKRAVSKCGIQSITHLAEDGREAQDYLLHQGRFVDASVYPAPDIMFLDLKLPHINGFEVLEWMRQHAECPQVPVFVLTSSSHPADRERVGALGAAGYMTKPPSPEQLGELLQKHRPARV